MDTEGFEYPSLTNMAKTGELGGIKQLLMEYHIQHATVDKLQVVHDVEKYGFKVFYTHKNPACNRNIKQFPVQRTVCYKVHYVRRP